MSENCVDIVRPFIEELGPEHDVQLVGGVGSFALKNEDVSICVDEKVIALPGDANFDAIGQYRPDGNLRDLDILVKSSNPDQVAAVESVAKAVIGDELVLSIFGLHSVSILHNQQRTPAHSLAKVWLSDRYVHEEGDKLIETTKALYPFAVGMDMESLENWKLIIGTDKPIPVPHPGTVVLNYLTRSISGLRPKDSDKIQELGETVFRKAPELVDWIVDGPGHSQLQLARILHTLREPQPGHVLAVGGTLEVAPYPLDALADHPAMLIPDKPFAGVAVAASRAKARGLHYAEGKSGIVTVWQKHMEPRIGRLLKNS